MTKGAWFSFTSKLGLFVCVFFFFVRGPLPYGLFLSLDDSEILSASEGYKLAVIDAQYVSAETIAKMKARGQEVFTYINLGALETFRDYHDDYKALKLADYENWENEFWINVQDPAWQTFFTELSEQLLTKGVTGFFVDNVDVYGNFPSEETFSAVAKMLATLRDWQVPVIVNGGDEFVTEAYHRFGRVDNLLSGVNQETVYTGIDFKRNLFQRQTAEANQYYLSYLKEMQEAGIQIYVTEYSRDQAFNVEIYANCAALSWVCYISDSIELDG